MEIIWLVFSFYLFKYALQPRGARTQDPEDQKSRAPLTKPARRPISLFKSIYIEKF